MSRRLLQLVIPVTPERRMFRIHDPAVDPDAPGGPLPPVGALISTNREQLWVGSLQEDINVRLVLEEWDGAPPPCGDAWDEEAKGSVYLRGQLSVSMGQVGTAVHGLRLGGGVGDYSVHVYASNRDVVTRRYTALFDRHRNPLSDEFQQEKRTLEGLERYLVQLWRESLAETGYGLTGGISGALAGLTLVSCALPVAVRLWLVVDVVRAVWRTAGHGRDRRAGRRAGRLRRRVPRHVRAERDHRVDHQRDHRDQQDREQRADDAGPGRTEHRTGARPAERRQARGEPGIVGREPPLDLREHPLLVLRQGHTATPSASRPG